MQYRVDLAECRNNPAARPVANAGTAPNRYENKANASAPGTAKTRSVPLPDQMAATTVAHPKGIEPIGGAMTPKNKAPLNALLIEKVILDHLLGDIGAVSMRFWSKFKVVESPLLAEPGRSRQHNMLSGCKVHGLSRQATPDPHPPLLRTSSRRLDTNALEK